jgi:hypothetical protein
LRGLKGGPEAKIIFGSRRNYGEPEMRSAGFGGLTWSASPVSQARGKRNQRFKSEWSVPVAPDSTILMSVAGLEIIERFKILAKTVDQVGLTDQDKD